MQLVQPLALGQHLEQAIVQQLKQAEGSKVFERLIASRTPRREG